jgi:hypothetical protein
MSEMLPAFRTRFVIGLAICVILGLAIWTSRDSAASSHTPVAAAELTPAPRMASP